MRIKHVDYEIHRPEYNEACDWDRMVRVVRARDRLRARGVTDGAVVPGERPVYRSQSNPEIETVL